MSLPENPITRGEKYLAKIAGQSVDIPETPITREEQYLDYIARNGGGGGGDIQIDDTLTQPGQAADAKAAGDAISEISDAVGDTSLTGIGDGTATGAVAALASILSNMGGIYNTAGWHNGIYRGKDITEYLTDGSLWDRIKGTNSKELFEDLYLGDYITVGSNTYAIADFDYYIRCGSTDINEHHLVMMPTKNMTIPAGTALYGTENETLVLLNGEDVTSKESATAFKWNATAEDPNTNTTAGGYKFSRMRTVIMKAANTIVVNAFGSNHVKPITVIYYNPSDATASGTASGWAWFDKDDQTDPCAKSICDLPNETQIYGQQVWGIGSAYTNTGYEIGVDKFQFAICALHRAFINTRAYYWLRSVTSAAGAALVNNLGIAYLSGSAGASGVRPRFLLVG